MDTPTYSRGCSVLCMYTLGVFHPQSLTSRSCRPNYLVYVNTLL